MPTKQQLVGVNLANVPPEIPSPGSVRPKKHLGQHFLADRRTAARIAGLAAPTAEETLVEIGPGTGALTQELLALGHAVTAVEYDSEAASYLRAAFAEAPLTLIEGDILTVVLPPGPLCLVGNLPYNLSSPILFRALEQRAEIRQMVFMVQREVAQRWAAPHGSRTYGILSVLGGYFYTVRQVFTVPPGVFIPPPKVTSAVVVFERRMDVPDVPWARFKSLVKTAFNQRRKTLGNALKGFPVALPASLASLRAEQLPPEIFAQLAVSPPPHA